MSKNNLSKKIYLDYAASTPLDSRVEKIIRLHSFAEFGNPSSLHYFGQKAIRVIDQARESIAKSIGADFRDIIFTGSATEANNLALRGAVKKIKKIIINNYLAENKNFSDFVSWWKPQIIVSSIEHESILKTAEDLKEEGIEVIYLPVNKQGIVNLEKLKKLLSEKTILVSVMYVNNEIGSIQPIPAISKIIQEFKKEKSGSEKFNKAPLSFLNSIAYPLFHSDISQALRFLPCRVDELGVDLATFSSHKIYGPKGIGALYIKNKSQQKDKPPQLPAASLLSPILTGGNQEFGFRAGTENTCFIAGFAEAVKIVEKERTEEILQTQKIKNYFWRKLKEIYPEVRVNGVGEKLEKTNLAKRFSVPGIINVFFPHCSNNELLIKLDIAGIAVSAGSACQSRFSEPSYVIQALGYSKKRAEQSLRFSFSKKTTKKEIDRTIKALKIILKASH